MTIRLPSRFLLFVVYTVGVLGASFGISYAVFEQRNDGEDTKLESLDKGIGNLSSQLDDLRGEVGTLQVEVALADDRRSTCDDLTLRVVLLAFDAAAGQLSATEATSQVDDLKHERQLNCEGVSLAQ